MTITIATKESARGAVGGRAGRVLLGEAARPFRSYGGDQIVRVFSVQLGDALLLNMAGRAQMLEKCRVWCETRCRVD